MSLGKVRKKRILYCKIKIKKVFNQIIGKNVRNENKSSGGTKGSNFTAVGSLADRQVLCGSILVNKTVSMHVHMK